MTDRPLDDEREPTSDLAPAIARAFDVGEGPFRAAIRAPLESIIRSLLTVICAQLPCGDAREDAR
jgi:hypothetical protein